MTSFLKTQFSLLHEYLLVPVIKNTYFMMIEDEVGKEKKTQANSLQFL